MRVSIGCLIVSACCCVGIPPSAAALTAERLVELTRVRQVALSDDGLHVAYTLEIPRADDDAPGSSFSELWVAQEGAAPRRYLAGPRRVSSPAWSPDGKRISYLVTDDEEKEARLRVIDFAGGESRALVEYDGAIDSYAWSPDGRSIAFIAGDAETEQRRRDKEAGRDWTVVDEQPEFHRLHVFDVASGTSRLLLDAELDVARCAWLPDGSALIVDAAESPRVDDEYMFSGLYRVALDGSHGVLTSTPGKLGPLAVSPDGSRLAFLGATTQNDPLAQSLFVVSTGGGPARNLTVDYAGSASHVAWTAGAGLVLITVERERNAIYRVDPETGSRRPVAWPRLIVGDARAAAGRIALAADSPSHPAELFVLDVVTGATGRWSHHQESVESLRLARQEVVEWSGSDGWPISGVLTYPLDYVAGRRYPLVLQVHGGPEGVSLDGWTSDPLYPVQPLAARGFLVLQPNYRGSQGRGVAFSKADHDDLGGKEFEDILAGIDHLVERGLADRNRVGTGGWSYGGYMSAWAATRHSDRFAASIVAAGLTNWIAFAGTTDIPHEMSLVHWDSWWFDEPELHWSRSPLAHLDKARTPTLIVHGEQDVRVHPEQSLELYTALRIKGVPTRLVLYPREPHGLNERAHRLDFANRAIDWFELHLADAGGEGLSTFPPPESSPGTGPKAPRP